jgi:hypothetical protein
LLRRLDLFSDGGEPVNGSVKLGATFKAFIGFRLEEPTSSFDACLVFDNLLGQRIFVAHSVFQPDREVEERAGDQTFVCEISSLILVPGEYKIMVTLAVPRGVEVDRVEDAARISIIDSDYYGTGKAPWAGFVVLKHQWYLM